MAKRVRPAQFVGLALLASFCFGADGSACVPKEKDLSTIEINNNGRIFTATVGPRTTHAWDVTDLMPASLLDGSADLYSTEVSLTSASPRELFVFDSVVSENFAPGGLPYWYPIPQPAHYINIGAPSPKATHTRTAPFMVLKSRLIDHGECHYPFLFFGEDGLFTMLNAKFAENVRKCGNKPRSVDGGFQATFLKTPQGFTDQNDDGFGFSLKYHIPKFLGMVDSTVELAMNYAVRTEAGLPAIDVIGPAFVSISHAGFADLRVRETKKAMRSLTATVGGCLPPGIDPDECTDMFHVAAVDKLDLDTLPPCTEDWQCPTGRCLGVPLRTQFRQAVFEKAGAEIALGSIRKLCSVGAAGDRECASEGPELMKVAYEAKGGPNGAWLQANLRSESFFCKQDPELRPGEGSCWYHPLFKRANVLPDRLELVWYDANETVGKDPATVDYEFIRYYDPSLASCGADLRDEPVSRIPSLGASLP